MNHVTKLTSAEFHFGILYFHVLPTAIVLYSHSPTYIVVVSWFNINVFTSLLLYMHVCMCIAVNEKYQEWTCIFCGTVNLLDNMIMCDKCLCWFHW